MSNIQRLPQSGGEERSTRYSLYLMYLMIYGATACFYPFLPHYLQSRGLNYVEIGFCFSLTSIVSIVSQPLWGYVADRWQGKRRTLFFLMVMCGLSILPFIFADRFVGIALSIILLIFFQGALYPLADSHLYALGDRYPSIQYGKVRLFGSAGFAFTAFGLGFLLKFFSTDWLFILYFGFMAATFLAFYRAKLTGACHDTTPHFHDVKRILSNPKFSIFILSVCIVSIASTSSGNYIAILVEKTGGNTAGLGVLWFLVALSELPLFFHGTRILERFGEDRIYLGALVLYAIRFFASSLCVNFIPVVLIQLLQAFTFPMLMLATTSKVNHLLPDNLKATGMTLLTALGFGLGGLIGNLGGGYVIKLFSVFFLFKLYGIICLAALAVFFLIRNNEIIL